MLMEPASKVSVPFTVVRRMRSIAPESATDPPVCAVLASLEAPTTPEQTQALVLELSKENVIDPCRTLAAALSTPIRNPPVPVEAFVDVVTIVELVPKYPEFCTDPEPICSKRPLVPLVETP